MKDYSKDELKIYFWMSQVLKLDPETVFYYADLFKQTDEGKYKSVIDMEELKFWTRTSDIETILEKLRELKKANLISLDVKNGDFIVGIKRACRGIAINRKIQREILGQLKNEPHGIDIAVIYTKMCIVGHTTNDVLYIDRFSSVKDCLAEGLDEKPEDVENALAVLKKLGAIDY